MKFMRMLRQYKIYRNIVISLVVIVCAVALVLAASLYALFSRMMREDLGRVATSTIQQASHVVSDLEGRTEALCNQLLAEADVIATMFRNPPKPVEAYHASQLLKRNRSIQPYVEWIGVINGQTQRVYNTVGLSQEDEQLLYGLVRSAYVKRQAATIQFEYDAPATGKRMRSIAFVNSSDLSTSQEDFGAVAVGVSPVYLRNLVRQATRRMDGVILVLDGQGNALTHTEDALIFENLAQMDYLSEARASRESGAYEAEVQGVHSLISYAFLPKLNWLLVSIQPYKSLEAGLRWAFLATVCIALSLTAVGIVLTLYLTSRAYNPVATALSGGGYRGARHTGGPDEVDFITLQLERKRQLEGDVRAISPLVKEAVLMQLITDWQGESDPAAMDHLGLSLTGPYYAVVLIAFDQEDQAVLRSPAEDRGLMRFVLVNMATELISGAAGRVEVVPVSNGEVAALLQLESGELPDKLPLCLSELNRNLVTHFDLSVSCAAGLVVSGPDAINESYLAARELLSYRFFEGAGCILLGDAELRGHSAYRPFPPKLEARLYAAVEEGDPQKLRQALAPCLSHLRTLTPDGARLLAHQLLLFVLRKLPGAQEDREAQAAHVRSIEQVGRCRWATELDRLMEGVMMNLARMRRGEEKPRTLDQPIVEMERYIERNFRNPAVSLETAADEQHRSAAYLGRLFKVQTGRSFSEALSQYRLGQAERLLIESELSIQEICGQVGLVNVSYFYTLFKKRYGCTPQNYRRRAPHG